MKKGLKFILLSMLIILAMIFVISCNEESDGSDTSGEEVDYTVIQTPNLTYQNGVYEVNISSDIEKIFLTSYFSVLDEATYEISTTSDFSQIIGDEVVISAGENRFFVKVKHGSNEKVYEFLFLKKKLCTIIFEINGSTETIAPIQCDQGAEIQAPSYSLQGYKINWDYDFSQPVEDDILIKATLVPESYKITVVAPGADIDGNVYDVNYGTSVEIDAPYKKGNLFISWEYNGAKFEPNNSYNYAYDIEIVAKFEEISYSINYNLNGGINSTQNPAKYTVSSEEIVLANPTWTDDLFEFGGWYTDSEFTTPITKIETGSDGNVELYAKWNRVQMPEPPAPTKTLITFNAPGYDCNGTTVEFTFGESYTLPTLAKNGYIFNGWTTGTASMPISGVWSSEEETLTLTPAEWTLRTYTVTYVTNGGVNDENNPLTFTVEDEIELLNPTKQYAKAFLGWYTDAELTQKIEVISGLSSDLTLYASWDYSKYTVTFNPNGGTIDSTEKEVVYGSSYELYVPVKNGYDFVEWCDENGNSVAINGQWLVETNVTLIAKWTETKYTIEYVLNGGNQIGTGWITEYTVNSPNFTFPIPEKSGEFFLGWTTDYATVPKTAFTLVKGTTGNLVLYANWCDEKDDKGILYKFNSDGTATVVGYTGTVGNILIPSEFEGHTVTTIGNDAFNGFGEKLGSQSGNNFCTLQIPKTITRIGANAFENCTDLKIQLIVNSKDDVKDADEITEWANKVIVESGNDQVIDVIKNIRPAIGWTPYKKP